jgi:hypothetical protein
MSAAAIWSLPLQKWGCIFKKGGRAPPRPVDSDDDRELLADVVDLRDELQNLSDDLQKISLTAQLQKIFLTAQGIKKRIQ